MRKNTKFVVSIANYFSFMIIEIEMKNMNDQQLICCQAEGIKP